ncbi:LamG domain-containing protein, partial [Candidatus Pacearchaeota archaeon]|nr:LamG domain-containing protein [Candidatus Pacearchaeota archaeon]
NGVTPKDEWTFVAMTYDSTSGNIYVNGELKASSPSKGRIGDGSMYDLFIGLGELTPGSYFNGDIDDVMIFNKALSEEELLSFYNQKFEKVDSENWAVYLEEQSALSLGEHTYSICALDSYANEECNSRTLTIASIPSPAQNSGGGGSGSYCETSWNCTSWGSCINGNQTRTCSKLVVGCNVRETKPAEKQSCLIAPPENNGNNQENENPPEIEETPSETPSGSFITGAVIGARDLVLNHKIIFGIALILGISAIVGIIISRRNKN